MVELKNDRKVIIMSLKHNYHMHTELCGHAKGTILDNILEGISLGYETLGFSEHAPLP